MMLPLLKTLEDREEHDLHEIADQLAKQFSLTDAERNELLASGHQTRFSNRVGWARTYLGKAGLLEITGLRKVRITQSGVDFLATAPTEITNKTLERFPGFVEFKQRREEEPAKETAQSPEEALAQNYQKWRGDVAGELLSRVKKCSSGFLEKLVVQLLVAMGYGGSLKDAGRAIGRSGDEGIDGVINEDKLGLDVVYVQAKRWDTGTVGRKEVQAFTGSLEGKKARKGVFITTSRFTEEALEYVKSIEKKVVLIDGERLTQLMIEYGIGVTEVESYAVKRIDLDFFEEE